jgi:hypothetical protein
MTAYSVPGARGAVICSVGDSASASAFFFLIKNGFSWLFGDGSGNDIKGGKS